MLEYDITLSKVQERKFLCVQSYRGSYNSVHDLLNLLNKLRKKDKMRGLP